MISVLLRLYEDMMKLTHICTSRAATAAAVRAEEANIVQRASAQCRLSKVKWNNDDNPNSENPSLHSGFQPGMSDRSEYPFRLLLFSRKGAEAFLRCPCEHLSACRK